MKKSKVALVLGAGIVGGATIVAVPVLSVLLSQANNKSNQAVAPSPVLPPVTPVKPIVKPVITNEITPAQAQTFINGLNKLAEQGTKLLSTLDKTKLTASQSQDVKELETAIANIATVNVNTKDAQKFTTVEQALLSALNKVQPIVGDASSMVTSEQAQTLYDGINKLAEQAAKLLPFYAPKTDAETQAVNALKTAMEHVKALTPNLTEIQSFTTVEQELLNALDGVKEVPTYTSELTDLTNQLVLDTTAPSGKYYITPEANTTVAGVHPQTLKQLQNLIINNRTLLNKKDATVDDMKAAIETTKGLITTANATYDSIKEYWFRTNIDVIAGLYNASISNSMPEEIVKAAETAYQALTQNLALEDAIQTYQNNKAKNIGTQDQRLEAFGDAALQAASQLSAQEVYERLQVANTAYLSVLKQDYKDKINALDSLLPTAKEQYLARIDGLPVSENLPTDLEAIYQEASQANEARKTLIAPLVDAITKAETLLKPNNKFWLSETDAQDTSLNAPYLALTQAIATAKAALNTDLTSQQVTDATDALNNVVTTQTTAINTLITNEYIKLAEPVVFDEWKALAFVPTTADEQLTTLREPAEKALTTFLNNADIETVKNTVLDTTTMTVPSSEYTIALNAAYANVNISQAKLNFEGLKDTSEPFLTRYGQDQVVDIINTLTNLTPEQNAKFIEEVRAVEGFLSNTNFKNELRTIQDKAEAQNKWNEMAKPIMEKINEIKSLTSQTGALYISDGLVNVLSKAGLTASTPEDITYPMTSLQDLAAKYENDIQSYTMESQFTDANTELEKAINTSKEVVTNEFYPAYMKTYGVVTLFRVSRLLNNLTSTGDKELTSEQQTNIKTMLQPALEALFASNGENAQPAEYDSLDKIIDALKLVKASIKPITIDETSVKNAIIANLNAQGIRPKLPSEKEGLTEQEFNKIVEEQFEGLKAAVDKANKEGKGLIVGNAQFDTINNVLVNTLHLTINQAFDRLDALDQAYLPAETEYQKDLYENVLSYATNTEVLNAIYTDKDNAANYQTYTTALEDAKVKAETPTSQDYVTAMNAIITAQETINNALIESNEETIAKLNTIKQSLEAAVQKATSIQNPTAIDKETLAKSQSALDSANKSLENTQSTLDTLKASNTKLAALKPAPIPTTIAEAIKAEEAASATTPMAPAAA